MTTDAQRDIPASGRVVGFWHAGVSVRDMAEALRFYCDGLGLQVETSYVLPGELASQVIGLPIGELEVTFLSVPGTETKLELHEYRGIERYPGSNRPCDYGSGHFCLFVDDLPALYDRLTALGFATRGPVAEIAEGPRKGNRAVYAISPDGYNVELFQGSTAVAESIT